MITFRRSIIKIYSFYVYELNDSNFHTFFLKTLHAHIRHSKDVKVVKFIVSNCKNQKFEA